MEKITFRVTKELKEKIERMAIKKGLSVSAFIKMKMTELEE